MGKVDRYDPVRMFSQGCAFYDIAELCEKEPNVFKKRTNSHFIGGLVNSLLACEIFMKTIIVIKDSNEKPKGHNLNKLWNEIEKLDSDFSQNIENITQSLYLSKNDKLYKYKLKVIEEQFKKLRYMYELDSIKSDPTFIMILRKVLKNECEQLIKEKL